MFNLFCLGIRCYNIIFFFIIDDLIIITSNFRAFESLSVIRYRRNQSRIERFLRDSKSAHLDRQRSSKSSLSRSTLDS